MAHHPRPTAHTLHPGPTLSARPPAQEKKAARQRLREKCGKAGGARLGKAAKELKEALAAVPPVKKALDCYSTLPPDD